MTLRHIASALALAAATLGAGAALAHGPRPVHTNPMAALNALNMPELAPARSLMREVLRDTGPHNRVVIVTEPEVVTRRAPSFFSFLWSPAPFFLRNDNPRCETVISPYGGRIETCTSPRLHPMPRTHGERRSLDLMLDLERRLESY